MKRINVKKDNPEIRLDKFLVREFFSHSRGEIIRNIRAGNVLVNNKKVKPSYILRRGDAISSKLKVRSEKLIPNRNIRIEIIYKDENIIVINKPAGLQVHPDKNESKNTLVNWLIHKFPEVINVHDDSAEANFRPGIVHRLDKDTSGVVVTARNIKAFQELKKLFKEHKIEKKYLALVYGKLKNKSDVISKPIARSSTYKKQVIAGRKTKTKIRKALTEYKVLKEFNDYSLLKVTPKTGRMHQIRIHLFSIGHPIVGDKIYKLKKLKRVDAPRQMLHAKSISFKLLSKNYRVNANIPGNMTSFMRNID